MCVSIKEMNETTAEVKDAISSMYKAFPGPEACKIVKKPEIHYTPRHGSWLDIAEIELNVMTRQCLFRRIEDIGLLRVGIALP